MHFLKNKPRFFVYFLTNTSRTVLYVGMTDDLEARLKRDKPTFKRDFVARYNAWFLLYFEIFDDFESAFARERELKAWRREKKIALIVQSNPNFSFLECPK